MLPAGRHLLEARARARALHGRGARVACARARTTPRRSTRASSTRRSDGRGSEPASGRRVDQRARCRERGRRRAAAPARRRGCRVRGGGVHLPYDGRLGALLRPTQGVAAAIAARHVAALANRSGAALPHALAGDFNAPPGTTAHSVMLGQERRRSPRAASPGGRRPRRGATARHTPPPRAPSRRSPTWSRAAAAERPPRSRSTTCGCPTSGASPPPIRCRPPPPPRRSPTARGPPTTCYSPSTLALPPDVGAAAAHDAQNRHRLRERPLEPGRWAFEGAAGGAAAAEVALETSLTELQRLCAALAFDQTRGCRCPSLSRAQTCCRRPALSAII